MKRTINNDLFYGRNILIATKHEKEKVIAPILEKYLGVKCIIDKTFDTDIFGTFTGEIDRIEDPISIARKKCMMAMEKNKCDLAISSEGSFGAHPSIFFSPADDEILMLVDKKNKLEIFSRELTTATNFNAKQISSHSGLISFAKEVKFPSHGLILRNSKADYSIIYKENNTWKILIENFNQIHQSNGGVYVETDMRAMNNPTRMKAIITATKKLAKKILSVCPECSTPGFSITDVVAGLPCELCHTPTRSALNYLYTCQKCNYQKTKKFRNKKKYEDAMYCDYCNP